MAGLYLDDCPEFETWLTRERELWRRQATVALEQLIVHYALQRQDDQAQSYARRWLELEPWEEEAHRYLMVLLARSGKRSAALAQYKRCRGILAGELGVEPDEETEALYKQIRNGTRFDTATRWPADKVANETEPASRVVLPALFRPRTLSGWGRSSRGRQLLRAPDGAGPDR